MPLRAGHELHEPAGPGRRDGLGVESRFDLDDRHDQPGFDPMLPGIPFREPRHAVRPHRTHQPLGAEAPEKLIPPVAVRPVRQKDGPVLPHMPIDGHRLHRQRIRRLS